MPEPAKLISSPRFPPKLKFLFSPMRYKVLRGGRGSAKSWSIARALLVKAAEEEKLILCAREFQNSITESVHRLLCQQIDAMHLGGRFKIADTSIMSRHTGSEFIFAGIRSNINKIKSTEGIDICWVEEAEKVSKHSWQVLIPTIRKSGSEIWVSFNPDEETDPTYQKFVVSPPPDCTSVEVNWRDNPWFPEELKKEKDYLFQVDPEAAEHVWEGKCNTRSDAQIFHGKYVVQDFEPLPNWHGPYFGQDFGFSSDPAATVKLWIDDQTNRMFIEHEAFGYGIMNDDLAKIITTIPGADKHIIRADCSRPETIVHLQQAQHGGLRMEPCAKWSGCVEDGIAFLRSFVQIVIHTRCKHMREEARLYRYKVDKITGDVLPVIVDKHNHGWDAVRYALEPAILRRAEDTIVIGEEVHISQDLDDYDLSQMTSNW